MQDNLLVRLEDLVNNPTPQYLFMLRYQLYAG